MMGTMTKQIGIGVCSSLCVLAVTISLLFENLSQGRGAAPRSDRETGTLRVLVKHKPYPSEWVKAAKVTVSRIEVRDAEHEDAWIVIREGEHVINLSETGNGRPSTLASVDVAPGRYDKMRLICTQGSVAVDDGQSLHWGQDLPQSLRNGEQAVIQLNCEFAVSAGDQTTVLIDTGLEDALRMMAANRQSDTDQVAGFHSMPPTVTAR